MFPTYINNDNSDNMSAVKLDNSFFVCSTCNCITFGIIAGGLTASVEKSDFRCSDMNKAEESR